MDKLGLGVRGAIDFREGAELGVGSEDEIGAGTGPFQFPRFPVVALEGVLGLVERGPGGAHVEEVDEEVVGQGFGTRGEDAGLAGDGVGFEDPQATDENGEFRSGQGQELGFVDEQFLGGDGIAAFEVVAEAIGVGFEEAEGFDIGLILSGVHAARGEGGGDVVTGRLGSLLHASVAAEDDEIRQGDFFACGLRGVEGGLDAFQLGQHFGELGGLVDGPVLLRSEADAAAVGSAAFVGAAEGGSGSPRGGDQFTNGQARRKDLALQGSGVLIIDQRVIGSGNRILPDEDFRRDFWPEITIARAHVAVRQLEPGAGEGVGELVRIRVETARDFFVGGVGTQGDV